jgi:CrcB protein
MNLASFLAVGAGAAVGAWLRWALSAWLNPLLPSMPLGTLAANLVGGLLIGLAMGGLLHADVSPTVRLLVTTGFLGGLTTFSAFSAETTALLLRGDYGWALASIAAHVGGSLAMTLVGWWLVAPGARAAA